MAKFVIGSMRTNPTILLLALCLSLTFYSSAFARVSDVDSNDPEPVTSVKSLAKADNTNPVPVRRKPVRVRRIGPVNAQASRVKTPRTRVVQSRITPMFSLADHLFGVPGVRISGGGPLANITIRGLCPLYVVDGFPLGYSYMEANTMAFPMGIESVEIMSSPKTYALYGMGYGGAIVITTSWSKDAVD